MKSLCKVLCLFLSITFIPFVSFAAEPDGSQTSVEAVAMRVNINTADADMISASLKGIGAKKAAAIVTYREELGGFTSIEQLLGVKGIGVKTLDKLRDKVVL